MRVLYIHQPCSGLQGLNRPPVRVFAGGTRPAFQGARGGVQKALGRPGPGAWESGGAPPQRLMAADPQDYAGERRRVAAGPTRPGCFWEFPAFLPSAGTVGAWDRRGPLLGPANRAGRAGPARMVRRFRCRTQRQVVLGQDQRGRPLNAVPLRSRRAGLGARRTAFTPLGWAPARPPEKQWGGCGGGWEWGGLDTADGVIGGDDDDDDRPGPRGLPLP